MVVVNWCGHGQEFVPWPEKDGYWDRLLTYEQVTDPLRGRSPKGWLPVVGIVNDPDLEAYFNPSPLVGPQAERVG